MVNSNTLPLKYDTEKNPHTVSFNDDCMIQWLTHNEVRIRLKTTEHIHDMLPGDTQVNAYAMDQRKEFEKKFKLFHTLQDISVLDIYMFLKLVADKEIVQPYSINHHGCEENVKEAMMETLQSNFEIKEDMEWSIHLVLLKSRVVPEGEIKQEDEMFEHFVSQRQQSTQSACQFATFDEFPWEKNKNNVQQHLQNADSSTHPRPYLDALDTSDPNIPMKHLLPYRTTGSDGLTYYWGVIDGLQRLSAACSLISMTSKSERRAMKLAGLKAKVYLYALHDNQTAAATQMDLADLCNKFSKELATNNEILSKHTLCATMTNVIIKTTDQLLPYHQEDPEKMLQCPKEILYQLIENIKVYMAGDEHEANIFTALSELLSSKDKNSVEKALSVILDKCRPTRYNVIVLYATSESKRRDRKEKEGYYMLAFLYAVFKCSRMDQSFLHSFANLKGVLTRDLIENFMPYDIHYKKASRTRCISGLYFLSVKDILETLTNFFGDRKYSELDRTQSRSNFHSCIINLLMTAHNEGKAEQVLEPPNLHHLADILVHKFLLRCLAINSARIQVTLQRGMMRDDSKLNKDNNLLMVKGDTSFPGVQFPFLLKNKSGKPSVPTMVTMCEKLPFNMFEGLTTALEDKVWIKRNGTFFPCPLTFAALVSDMVNSKKYDETLPVELFHDFQVPVKQITVHLQIQSESKLCPILCINNLFGMGCGVYSLSENHVKGLEQANLSLPIEYKDLKLAYNVDFEVEDPTLLEDEVSPYTLETGCHDEFVANVLTENLSCVAEVERKKDTSGVNISIGETENESFVGLLLLGRLANTGVAHFVAYRKEGTGKDDVFICLDSYAKTLVGTCRLKDFNRIPCGTKILKVWRKQDEWKNKKYLPFDKRMSKKNALHAPYFFEKSSFSDLPCYLHRTSENFTYLDTPPDESVLRILDFEKSIDGAMDGISGENAPTEIGIEDVPTWEHVLQRLPSTDDMEEDANHMDSLMATERASYVAGNHDVGSGVSSDKNVLNAPANLEHTDNIGGTRTPLTDNAPDAVPDNDDTGGKKTPPSPTGTADPINSERTDNIGGTRTPLTDKAPDAVPGNDDKGGKKTPPSETGTADPSDTTAISNKPKNKSVYRQRQMKNYAKRARLQTQLYQPDDFRNEKKPSPEKRGKLQHRNRKKKLKKKSKNRLSNVAANDKGGRESDVSSDESKTDEGDSESDDETSRGESPPKKKQRIGQKQGVSRDESTTDNISDNKDDAIDKGNETDSDDSVIFVDVVKFKATKRLIRDAEEICKKDEEVCEKIMKALQEILNDANLTK